HVEIAFAISEDDLFTHVLFPPPIRRLEVYLPLAPREFVVEELDAHRPAATAKRAPSATAITGAITAAEQRAPRPFDSAADHPAGPRLAERRWHDLTTFDVVKHGDVELHTGESPAAGGVDQPAVPRRVADAATDARQPIDPGLQVHVHIQAAIVF